MRLVPPSNEAGANEAVYVPRTYLPMLVLGGRVVGQARRGSAAQLAAYIPKW